MAAVDWDPVVWAEVQFGTCELGDRQRNKRLVNMAQQFAARPDANTPQQTETWGDLKAAYRLFDQEDVTPAATLVKAIGDIQQAMSAQTCLNLFEACGYL